ncbi:MAG TPA: response regulator [Thermodesulfovibrionales bacterium]|nr:response regulator [Thermodesulfovibrionales bacterium]
MTAPLRILHLEDDPFDAELVKSTLEGDGISCETVRVETRDDFVAAVCRDRFDIIFADYSLPGFDGLSALEIVGKECPEVPFIFVSGKMGEELAIETLKRGATDYVLKNRISRLAPSLRRALREAEGRKERRKTAEELEGSREQLRNLAAHLQSVREEERRNVARDIHDEFGQILAALKMNLAWISDKYGDHGGLRGKLKPAIDLVDRTILSVRRICTDLRPEILDHFGLGAAIEWQAREFQKEVGIECQVTVSPEDLVLEKDLSTALFRVFQEALTNVIRHSQATKVAVMLTDGDGSVTLGITDNGIGITEEQVLKKDSFGLLGIRERIQGLNGEVRITGSRESGTTIGIVIPKR